MSKKDEVKSLVNSVNMVKNMVESIVAAVQDRFKDYDNVVVTLKERIDLLESQPRGVGQEAGAQVIPSDLSAKFDMLEKRLDSLNERLLLIEATKSVHEEPTIEATDVEALKAIAEKETKVETEFLPDAPSVPVPTPVMQKPTPEPTIETEVPSVPPSLEAPSMPIPAPPEITPETAVEEVIEKPPEAPPAQKSSVQISETVERDVSPISKEVSSSIPMPPKQEEVVREQEPIQPQVPKTDPDDSSAPEEGKSAELFGEAVSGDKAELLKALKKLEDL